MGTYDSHCLSTHTISLPTYRHIFSFCSLSTSKCSFVLSQSDLGEHQKVKNEEPLKGFYFLLISHFSRKHFLAICICISRSKIPGFISGRYHKILMKHFKVCLFVFRNKKPLCVPTYYRTRECFTEWNATQSLMFKYPLHFCIVRMWVNFINTLLSTQQLYFEYTYNSTLE